MREILVCPTTGVECIYTSLCATQRKFIADGGDVLAQTYDGQSLGQLSPEVVMAVAEDFCVNLRIDRLGLVVRDCKNPKTARQAETVAEELATSRVNVLRSVAAFRQ